MSMFRASKPLTCLVFAASALVCGAGLVWAADSSHPSKEREGGVRLQMPQSPEMIPVDIGYLREELPHPRPASRLDVEPEDAGIAGAKMGVGENNAGGRFMGHFYALDVKTASSPEDALGALEQLHETGHNYIIVDASAPIGPRTRTFSCSTSAPPTSRSGSRSAARTSCTSCRTAT